MRHKDAPAGKTGASGAARANPTRFQYTTAALNRCPAPMVESALEYASRDWAVFPLMPGGKVPLKGSHGVTDATSDVASVRQWWALWPDANLGAGLGRGRVVAIDVDRRHAGDETLAALEAEYEPLPTGPAVITSDGGHFYFSANGRTIPTRQLGPGLELRGDGAYTVAPPSIHPSGHKYAWSEPWSLDFDDLPPLPTWLRALRSPVTATVDSPETAEPKTGTRTELGTALARLMAAHDVLPAVLPLVGLPHDLLPAGRAARCPLCDDRHPSSSLYVNPRTGAVNLRSWHMCRGREWWLLPEVYAARTTGQFVRLSRAGLAAWTLRLLRDSGVVAAPVEPPYLLNAPDAARVVFRALILTSSASESLAENCEVAFSRQYGMALTGLSEHVYRDAWDWLRDRGFASKVSDRANGRPSLWLPQNSTTDDRDERGPKRDIWFGTCSPTSQAVGS